jgi:hypothetical protein
VVDPLLSGNVKGVLWQIPVELRKAVKNMAKRRGVFVSELVSRYLVLGLRVDEQIDKEEGK